MDAIIVKNIHEKYLMFSVFICVIFSQISYNPL